MKLYKNAARMMTTTALLIGSVAVLSLGAFAAEVDVNEDPTIAGYLPPQETMVQGEIALHSAQQEELPYGGYLAPPGEQIQGNIMLIGVEDLTGTSDAAAEPVATMPTVEIKMTGLLRKSILYTASQKDRVLTVAAPENYAVLRLTVGQVQELMDQGVGTLVLNTENKSTTLNLTLLCDGYDAEDKVTLRHIGSRARLTVGGKCRNELLIAR